MVFKVPDESKTEESQTFITFPAGLRLEARQAFVLPSKHVGSLQKSATCFDDPDTWNVLCPLMRDSCGLKGKHRRRGEHTCRRAHLNGHTHLIRSHGSLQKMDRRRGRNAQRGGHTLNVSQRGTDGSWLWLRCWPLTPKVKRYGKANTHLCDLFPFFYVRTFTLRHFAGRSNCRATVCVEGRGVTSHHMRVRITSSWIHFDVGGTEGRRRRLSRSCLRFCVENVTIIGCYDGVVKESDDESRHCAIKRKLSSKRPEFPEWLHWYEVTSLIYCGSVVETQHVTNSSR